MKAAFAIGAALAFLAASAGPVLADHCMSSTTSRTWADSDPAGLGTEPRLYVAIDSLGCPTCLSFFSFCVYEESNGIDGLQRGDEVVDDTCHGRIAADTIVL